MHVITREECPSKLLRLIIRKTRSLHQECSDTLFLQTVSYSPGECLARPLSSHDGLTKLSRITDPFHERSLTIVCRFNFSPGRIAYDQIEEEGCLPEFGAGFEEIASKNLPTTQKRKSEIWVSIELRWRDI